MLPVPSLSEIAADPQFEPLETSKEEFEGIWENAPDYLNKGMEVFATLKKVGEGFAEEAERRSVNAWRDMNAQFGN